MAEFVVYGLSGSPSLRATLMCCEEKGTPYRFIALPPGDPQSAYEPARDPFGCNLVLYDGDFRVYGTQAIIRYIDTASAGPSLQPRYPRATARMNQIIGIVDEYVAHNISVLVSWLRVVAPTRPPSPADAAVAASMPEARVCIDELDRLLGDMRFVAGDEISLGDIMLAPHLALFALTPEGRRMLAGTRLRDWLTRMLHRDSMQRTEREHLRQIA